MGDPATLDYPIFYVKRTVPVDEGGNVVQDDLRVMRDAVPKADLYERAAASPSAAETNITARITAGAAYDIKDVDVSADGTRVVFAMRGPLAANQDPTKPPSWRIWQYVLVTNTLGPVINPGHRSGSAHGQRRLAALPAGRAHRVQQHAADAVAGHAAQ